MILLKGLKHLATLGVVLLVLATAFAAWSVRIPPAEMGKGCLVWFAFPYLWLLTVAVGVVCFAFKGWFQFFCCLVAAVATWGSARLVVDVPSSDSEAEPCRLKVVTYNVHYMSHAKEMTLDHVRDSLFSFLLNSDADVICLQEAPRMEHLETKDAPQDPGVRLLKKYPYRVNGTDRNLGQMTLSRHKMTEVPGSTATFNRAQRKGAIVATDIFIGADTFRIVNCHLASLALTDSEIEAVNSKRDVSDERKSRLHQTYAKMKKAFDERQEEVEILKAFLGQTKTPVIVCGDFNDTPISYTYHTLTSGAHALRDARTPRGLGLAKTYRGALPPLRIDYILTSEGIRTSGYEVYDLPVSDHRGVGVRFER